VWGLFSEDLNDEWIDTETEPFSSSAARESRFVVEDERLLVVARFPSRVWEFVGLALSMVGEEECCGLLYTSSL